nr:glycosyltransferase [Bacteroidaceae bacterium]
MKLAIVILNWNGSRMMQQYLPSVILYSTLPGVEIIVADNASTDDSISMLSAQFPSIRILKLDQNYGFAEGYNRALAQVREAEYWLLLNSDVEVTEGWLEPMLHYMDTHPEVAACQPKIRSVEQREFFEFAGAAGGFIDRYGYPFCRGRLLSFI